MALGTEIIYETAKFEIPAIRRLYSFQRTPLALKKNISCLQRKRKVYVPHVFSYYYNGR